MKTVYALGAVSAVFGWAEAASITLAGAYKSAEDVTQHARISLDVAEMSEEVKAGSWSKALETYQVGGNSKKSATENRTLEGFSTAVKDSTEKIGGQSTLPDLYKFIDYFGGSPTYSDDYIKQMIHGHGAGGNLSDVAREQYVIKTIQYQSVYMYILYEMAKAIHLCGQGPTPNGQKNWDEAVAFYAGIDVGPSVSCGKESNYVCGSLFWTFANKRCGKFGGCDADGLADTNKAAFDAFNRGLENIQSGNCLGAAAEYMTVRKQMQIALLRGVIDYGTQKSSDNNPKNWAEAWAFARAVLPYLNDTDANTHAAFVSALKYEGNDTETGAHLGAVGPVYDLVYSSLDSMCISCYELGVSELANAQLCETNSESLQQGCDQLGLSAPTLPAEEKEPLDLGLIIGLSVAALTMIIALVAVMYWINKKEAANEARRNDKVRSAASESSSERMEEANTNNELQQV